MKHILMFIFACLSLLAWSQEFKAINDPSSVKRAIEKKHEEVTSIQADFIEKSKSTLLKETQLGNGTFLYKRKEKVRWDNVSQKQLILINGEKVKLFENGKLNTNPTSQRVVKQVQGMMLSMISGDFLNEKDFKIVYSENSKYNRLLLTPKNSRMSRYIEKIELLFNKKTNLLDEMTLFESKQQSISYTFTNQKINLAIADSKFTQQ